MDGAPPRPPVHIEGSACAATPLADVVAILRVELPTQLVEGPAPGDAYRVGVECAGERVIVAITTPGAATRSFETNLEGAPPSVRPRIVALAIAEVVRDLDRAPAPPPPAPPVIAPEPPAAVTPERSPTPARSRRAWRVAAYGQASRFGPGTLWFVGGGLGVDYAQGRLDVALDAAVLSASDHLDLGATRALLAYGNPSLAWRETFGPFESRVGAGCAIGVASVTGEAAGAGVLAGTVTGPWVAPDVFAALGARVTGALEIGVRAQVGWVTVPVIGEVAGHADVAMQGLWASALLGAALAFDAGD